MRIMRFYEYGGPEVLKLEEVERPHPQAGEILVKVEVIGLNYADTMQRRGMYPFPVPFPIVLGGDVVGRVITLGEGVTSPAVGTCILTALPLGAYAEYITVPARTTSALPTQLSVHDALVLPVQGQTAYHVLTTAGHLRPGESVLIQAAAGGVGSLAVQLAKALGAGLVIATASTERKLDLVRSLGADVAINYTQPDWAEQVQDATQGKGVDLVLEMVGGTIFDHSIRLLAPFGRFVFFGAASGENRVVEPIQLMNMQACIGFGLPPLIEKRPDLLEQGMQTLLTLIEQGKVKPVIHSVLPFEQAAEAHHLLETRQTVGKVVLTLEEQRG